MYWIQTESVRSISVICDCVPGDPAILESASAAASTELSGPAGTVIEIMGAPAPKFLTVPVRPASGLNAATLTVRRQSRWRIVLERALKSREA